MLPWRITSEGKLRLLNNGEGAPRYFWTFSFTTGLLMGAVTIFNNFMGIPCKAVT